MTRLIILVVLALLTLAAASLQKTYARIPRKELKRRAQKGDDTAKQLYKAAAHGLGLGLLLWLVIGLAGGGFIILLARWTALWLALIGALGLVGISFAWLPNSRVSPFSEFIARQMAPLLAWLLNVLSPVLGRLAEVVRRHGRLSVHSGLYEKEDLLVLLDRQKTQLDNRLSDEELTIAKGALTYSDKLVRDIMVPRRVIKTVATTDTVGPILMDELHATGHSRFPVYQDKADNIIGTLYARDLMKAKEGGQVHSVMKKDVHYVREDQPLGRVLEAFLKTKHHLFVVVNNFEEVVGIITIEDILEQILGKPILDEFDKYQDLRAVAALEAQQDQKKHENGIDKVLPE